MAETSDKQGQRSVGQYYIMEKIAQGGMAEIFKGLAYDVHGINQKAVCIKKILSHLSADRDFIGSIIDEAKLAVKLVHGNIAQTYDLGKVGDDYYMVMEFVDGATLSHIHKRCLSQGTLIPLPIIGYFISEIAQGLDYMHRRTDEDGRPLHIVHRDISPQNIMVSYSGTVKIIDFGIAKAAFKAGPTESGILKGKFAYMSPEQAFGDSIDHRSDIYSLGIILHEVLTGKRLFKAADSRQTIRNVRNALVNPPSMIRAEIPDDMDRIAMKALAKDRRRRYPYASELRDDLVKFLHKNFPEFKPSDAAAFVQELFRNEIADQRPLEADSKTPALIIDRTNSALASEEQFEVTGAAKMPANVEEFMVDDLPQELPEKASHVEHPIEDIDHAIPDDPAFAMAVRRRRLWHALRNGAVAFLVCMLLFGAYFLWKHLTPASTTAPSLAEVMVVATPSDAVVVFDGRQEGKGSPVSIKNVEPDVEHTLRVSKDGYLTYDRRLSLEEGEFLSLNVDLTSAAPPIADIDIVSTPPGATVYVDDKETAYRTPAKIKAMSVSRPHTVGLYLEGYKFWSKEVELKGGQMQTFDVVLAKNFGSARFDVDPAGSLVIIDGVPAGQTPLTKDDLDPQKIYSVEIWHEGYQSATRELRPLAGKQVDIRIELEKEKSVPLPSPAPPAETPAP
jgi:serine/threonine protein kinase